MCAIRRATPSPRCGPCAGGRVVVVAAAPARVGPDRLQLRRGPARSARPTRRAVQASRSRPRTRSGLDRRAHSSARMPPMRAADHRGPGSDAERVGQRDLGPDLVSDGQEREPAAPRPPVGSQRGRPGAALAAAEHVRRDHEPGAGSSAWPGPISSCHQPGVGCPGPAGPVTWLSPVSACRTSTALEPSGRERAPGLVRQPRPGQRPARLQRERLGQRRATAGGPAGLPPATPRWGGRETRTRSSLVPARRT